MITTKYFNTRKHSPYTYQERRITRINTQDRLKNSSPIQGKQVSDIQHTAYSLQVRYTLYSYLSSISCMIHLFIPLWLSRLMI
ncbi:hypothetical protein BDB01DRAFT_897105 [Pilobolus umbonatus]|nr:hypothetical protein BDB01DRAFT_897105 [Pilobolus umbonatus]